MLQLVLGDLTKLGFVGAIGGILLHQHLGRLQNFPEAICQTLANPEEMWSIHLI
jgi:hypothetical protein